MHTHKSVCGQARTEQSVWCVCCNFTYIFNLENNFFLNFLSWTISRAENSNFKQTIYLINGTLIFDFINGSLTLTNIELQFDEMNIFESFIILDNQFSLTLQVKLNLLSDLIYFIKELFKCYYECLSTRIRLYESLQFDVCVYDKLHFNTIDKVKVYHCGSTFLYNTFFPNWTILTIISEIFLSHLKFAIKIKKKIISNKFKKKKWWILNAFSRTPGSLKFITPNMC